jgi:hypothetical protein
MALLVVEEVRAMVRPIDLQDVLSKAPLAEKVQQVQQQQPETQQRQFAIELQAEAARRRESVEASTQGDEVTLSEESGGERGGGRETGDEESPDEKEPPAEAQGLDVVA